MKANIKGKDLACADTHPKQASYVNSMQTGVLSCSHFQRSDVAGQLQHFKSETICGSWKG